MKSFLTLCAGLALGGIILWSVQQLGKTEEPEPLVTPTLSGEESSVGDSAVLKSADPPATSTDASQKSSALEKAAPTDGLPPLAGGPIFYDEEPEPALGATGHGLLSGGSPPESDAVSDLRRLVDVSALEKERELSQATFDVGERDRAKRMMERFYEMWKENASLDLTPEVQRLLEVEDDFSRRREYCAYLTARESSSKLYEEQIRRAVNNLTRADDGKAAAFAAWEDLTLAYELARNREERAAVLTHLEPFLKRNIFAGRASSLLTTYTVKAGDNLSSIADRFKTTVGSIVRLNGLTSHVIQPRQRLRLLPGKVRVYVHKSDFRLWLSVDDRFLLELPVGLGRDDATPTGTFVIRVKEKDPSWWKPGQAPIPAGDPRNILGSRWLGFADTEEFSGYGIHGTTDPSSIGRESSAGCVRLKQEDVELLYDLVPYKTEVVIRR